MTYRKCYKALRTGLIHLGKNECKEALRDFIEVTEIDSEYEKGWYNKGRTLYQLCRYEEAVEAFDEAIKVDSKEMKAWKYKSRILHLFGRPEEAVRASNKAAKIELMQIRLLNNKSCSLDSLKKYKEALKSLNQAQKINPTCAYLWYNKGIVLTHLGRYEKAVEAYDKAIVYNFEGESALNNKGEVLCHLGRHMEAIEIFDEAIQIAPLRGSLWVKKSQAQMKLTKYNEGINCLKDAIKKTLDEKKETKDEIQKTALEKKETELYVALIFFLLKRGDVDSALVELDKILTPNSTNASLWFLKGKIEFEKKNYKNSSFFFKKSASLNLDNQIPILWNIYAKYWYAKIYCNHNENKFQEEIHSIIIELEKSLNTDDLRIKSYTFYFLGHMYYEIKDPSNALKQLMNCRSLKKKINKDYKDKQLSQSERLFSSAESLLSGIWNHQMKYQWWNWWLVSPLHSLTRKAAFMTLFLSIIALFLLSFQLPSFVPLTIDYSSVNWTMYEIFVLFLIFILISPTLARIKSTGFEIEMQKPPSIEFSVGEIGCLFEELGTLSNLYSCPL